MADSSLATRRGEKGQDFQLDQLDLRRRKIEAALPAHFVQNYPEFVEFLTVYYEYLEADQGLDRMIERLRDVRNTDIADEEYLERLLCEYGQGIPDLTALSDQNALRIFSLWYRSKGSREAMEAYFRLFLNSEAEVIYPKDNMLRVSDGNWNNDAGRWENQDGHLSESTMVIQDSVFYQIYSYLVRSGVSIADWGQAFRDVAHPAGWNLFGEVRIDSLAQFEQFRDLTLAGARSPTQVPGFQVQDATLLILATAIYFVVENVEASPVNHAPRAYTQFILKTFGITAADGQDAYTLEAVNKNLLRSTYTVGELKDFVIRDIYTASINKTISVKTQRPTRITIT